MKKCKQGLSHILFLLREDKLKNDSVENEMLVTNNQRMILAGFIGMLLHIAHVAMFKYSYFPTTQTERIWQNGIMAVHGINAIVLMVITILAVFLSGRSGYTWLKRGLEAVINLDILFVGIALVTIDQYVTSNITALVTICTIVGILILKRPSISFCIYMVTYFVYYYAIDLFQTDPDILMTNRVNGITSVCIGFGVSLIMWYTYRQNILQNRLIEEQRVALEKLAFHDSLTGLYNRNRWISDLNVEMTHINRNCSESCAILLDIDYFKSINDKYGHPIGDKVLVHVACLLKKELRATDIVARWGGEEFIILLPGANLTSAMTIAEKLRSAIESAKIMIDDISIDITASFGVVDLSSKQDFTRVYGKVDESLYLAKQRGRNRVESVDLTQTA